jgi:HSP20 family protein
MRFANTAPNHRVDEKPAPGTSVAIRSGSQLKHLFFGENVMSTTLAKPRAQAPATKSQDPLSALRQEINDLMSRFWDGGQDRNWFAGAFAPEADLVEEDNAFEIRLDLPGMESKDIDVQVHGNTVTISGQRKEEKEEKGKTYHRIERKSGSFSRVLTLPCTVNEDEVAADYAKGVLTVKLPKCEEAKNKKITVKG